MRIFRFTILCIALAICPKILHAQEAEKTELVFLEFLSSIQQSKYQDAVKWAQEAKNKPSKEFADLAFRMRQAGIKSPQSAY